MVQDIRDYRMCPSAANLVYICIDSCESGAERGRLYHRFSRDAVPFQTMTDLLIQMDLLFDRINYPQAAMELRSFRNQKKKAVTGAAIHAGAGRGGGVLMEKENENMVHEPGEVATFVVHVRYRQNATWQGDVLWAEKREKVNFRSALELIRLMDRAIEEESGETESVSETK